MKFLCEGCERLATPTGFRVVSGTLELTCSACGKVALVDGLPELPTRAGSGGATQAAPLSAQAAPLTMQAAPLAVARPPAPRPPAPAAARSQSSLAPAGEADEAWLEPRWQALRLAWEDPATHDRVIAEAIVAEQLAPLGRRYSDWLAQHPDDAAAKRARDELLRRATARLMAELPRIEPGITPADAKNVRNGAMVLVLLAIAAFAIYVLMHSSLLAPGR